MLRDQFHAKLAGSSKNVFSETDLLQAALELRFEQGFPRSLSERSFVRRMIQDAVLKTIPLSATYPFEGTLTFCCNTEPYNRGLTFMSSVCFKWLTLSGLGPKITQGVHKSARRRQV